MFNDEISLLLCTYIAETKIKDIKYISITYRDNALLKWFFLKRFYRSYFLNIQMDNLEEKVIKITPKEKDNINKYKVLINFKLHYKTKTSVIH